MGRACKRIYQDADAPRGILVRLARDVRANTLILFAFALVPLCAMIGGGIDLSRMYLVKTRLQHACDAGALAGRKSMGGGTWAQSSYQPRTQAERFFDANIARDAYGSANMQRSFSESAGRVTGTASADVPMTMMRVLGATTRTLSVGCASEMRLPNTDVMFVLDVTGSMNCVAGDKSCVNNGDVPAPGSRIAGLKVAVKCFYEIVARLDSNADCEGGAPSGGTGSDVQIRFGFVPYSVNVNVGRLLPSNFFVDRVNYDTRQFKGRPWGEWQDFDTVRRNARNTCEGIAPADTAEAKYRATEVSLLGLGILLPRCKIEVQRLGAATWDYGSLPLDVSGLKNGNSWKSDPTFTAQIGENGAAATVRWSGCVEERQTVAQSSYDPIPAGAKDLNIDLVPVATDDTTRWRPSLPEATYLRASTGAIGDLNTAAKTTITTNYVKYGAVDWAYNYYCPTEARLLQSWPSASAFDAYVDGLQARGNTYHDIGMIWGARLLSPTGIRRAQNQATSRGGAIERHLIFMTDGDATASPCDYSAYGVHFLARRQTTEVGPASECASTRAALVNQINARLTGLCTAVKNKDITLWVVSFGGDVNAATEARLKTCASDGRYFKATDSAALQRTFRSIADQISALRLIN